jgi:FkbM family methyltransferase
MPISEISPFRQLVHAYSSFLRLSNSADEISRTLNGSFATMNASIQALAGPAAKDIDMYKRLGFEFVLDRSSLVDRCVIETGQWEPKQLALFTRLAELYRGRKNNVFLDIGAYWGLYSFMFMKTRIFDQIYAFEADAHNFSQLQTQIFLNRAAREIKAFNKAISARNQVMHVWDSLSHPDGNRGGVGMVHEGFQYPTPRIDAVTIDSFLTLSDCNLAIKIDVEGHEQHVLPGMERTVRENRIIMQVEVYEQQADATFPILEKLGLRRFNQIEYDFYYTNIDSLGIDH